MEITKEKLEKHMADLERERQKLLNTIFMYDGAVEECRGWLDELEKVEIPEESPAPQETSDAGSN